MSFCAFSKDFTANMYTSVENQFITKYLPQADGDAVRAYLYGLYLCQCNEEFDAENASKLLHIAPKRFREIFDFWEECDLVHVLSREPLFVEYLPVNSAVGKPKTVKPEKYAEFNRELYKLLQKAGKEFRPFEMQKILEFLEKEPMEQQAFLLVVEYCVKKDGEKLSFSHVINKAEKLCRENKFTYEQVEADLADFNVHERELSHIFTLLGIYRKPRENDYDYLEKWLGQGVNIRAVYAAADFLKKGTLPSLDLLVGELAEKDATDEERAREYLARREALADIVFKVARKLGVKVQNPRPFADEYAEKWSEHGYGEEELTLLAGLGMRLGYGFPELDALIETLYGSGVVDGESVKEYCASQDRRLRLLQRIQSVCGVVRKTQSALDMIEVWRSRWNFSEEMIMEAARRSANASAPLSYMNKLLSEWKRAGAAVPAEIPEKPSETPRSEYRSEAAIAADLRSERERFYSVRRNAALSAAEAAKQSAERDEGFRKADAACRKGEIELAKAEVFSPSEAETIRLALERSRAERREALSRLGLTENDFTPKFVCEKCSDTGYLPNGKMCDCYRGA